MPFKSLFRKSKEEKTSSEPQQPSKNGSPALSVPLTYGDLPLRTNSHASANQSARPTAPIRAPNESIPPLPAGLTAERDARYGSGYYVNIYTEESQWQKPTAPVYPPKHRRIKLTLADNNLANLKETGPDSWLPEGWKAQWDPRQNALVYVNVHNGCSQREKPTKSVYTEHKPRDYNRHFGGVWQNGQAIGPKWYIQDSDVLIFPRDHPDYLCANCRHIDLLYLFQQSEPARTAPPRDYIHLGPFREMAEEVTCGLCSIVTATIRERLKLSTRHEGVKLQSDVEKLLTAEWYLSPFVYEHESKPVTHILHLQHSIFDDDGMNEDTPFALRMVFNGKRGGRRIPDGILDFSWIRTTIERCDINTEFPPQDFDFPLLVVDVQEMCVTELDTNIDSKYVALSYPWGNVQQLKLIREKETSFRQPGGLSEVFDRLARTIQDAIILVSKVGLRYLWVDSLCIFQDDETAKNHQIAQMEKVYRHAYFTIFAISGQDSNFGLPGVRKGSRSLTQVVKDVSGVTVANCLPKFSENESSEKLGAWGSRAWTFQERFFSQRALFVGIDGMYINCAHVVTPEDEHCWHPEVRAERAVVHNNYHFFAGLDSRCEPFLGFERRTTFDSYAIFIYDYTQRKLTYELDAIRAFSGVLRNQARSFGGMMLYGLPEAEFDAGLLWSPLSSSARRTEFPSWSWVGWTGTAAYPWTHERDTFMSTENSPLKWLDANVAKRNQALITHLISVEGREVLISSGRSKLFESEETDAAWFISDDLCLPDSNLRDSLLRNLRKSADDHLGARVRCRANQPTWRLQEKYRHYWPDDKVAERPYTLPLGVSGNQRLTFRTLTAHFCVVGEPFRRTKPYNITEPIWRLTVCDNDGVNAGYIDIPDPCGTAAWKQYLGYQHFAVLSRSTIDGRFEPPPDRLDNRRREHMSHKSLRYEDIEERFGFEGTYREKDVNEAGWFDTYMYEETRPWCMFNVLQLVRKNGILYRNAIGRIHVDAFLAHDAKHEIIELE